MEIQCLVCGADGAPFQSSRDPALRTCSRNCQYILRGIYPLLDNPTASQIEQAVLRNTFFRKVIYTNRHEPGGFQLVAMHVPAGGAVGWERHLGNMQYFKVMSGGGHGMWFYSTPAEPEQRHAQRADARRLKTKVGDVWFVEPGQWHDVQCGNRSVQLLSSYTPPHHPDNRIDATREDADAREAAEALAAANADLDIPDLERLGGIFRRLADAIAHTRVLKNSRGTHEQIAQLFNGPILKPTAVTELEALVPGLHELDGTAASVVGRDGHVFAYDQPPGWLVIVSSGTPYVQFVPKGP